MINNSFTKKIAEALSRNKSGSSFDRSIMHVEREWYTLVGLAVLLLVTGALWSVYAYKTYSNVSISGDISSEEISVYKGEVIQSALKYREERLNQYEKLKGTIPQPAPVEEVETEDEAVTEIEPTENEPELIEDPASTDEATSTAEVSEEVRAELAI